MYDDKEKEPFMMNLQLSRIVQLRDAIEILCYNADKMRAVSELTFDTQASRWVTKLKVAGVYCDSMA